MVIKVTNKIYLGITPNCLECICYMFRPLMVHNEGISISSITLHMYGLHMSKQFKKVKCSRYRPGVAQRVGRGMLYSSMTAALEGGEWAAARPGRTLPSVKTRYPFYRRLGGPQGRSGRAENLVPTSIRSRTVQPVVSRYTD